MFSNRPPRRAVLHRVVYLCHPPHVEGERVLCQTLFQPRLQTLIQRLILTWFNVKIRIGGIAHNEHLIRLDHVSSDRLHKTARRGLQFVFGKRAFMHVEPLHLSWTNRGVLRPHDVTYHLVRIHVPPKCGWIFRKLRREQFTVPPPEALDLLSVEMRQAAE
jgi:hypothetical protein